MELCLGHVFLTHVLFLYLLYFYYPSNDSSQPFRALHKSQPLTLLKRESIVICPLSLNMEFPSRPYRGYF